MRVIAGKHKGLVLVNFDLSSTRPTSDMIREALFDKIGIAVGSKSFLDLFAGTGAVGIEAMSRGASECVFADQNNEAIKIIHKNLDKLCEQNYVVKKNSFADTLLELSKANKKFDFVFLDPPYASDYAEISIQMLVKKSLLNNSSTIIWEHDKSKLNYVERNFSFALTKKYGDKYLTYIDTNQLINMHNNG